MSRFARLLFSLVFLLTPGALAAQYAPDPTTAFASGTNPSGPWRFGYKSIDAPLGSFTDFTSFLPVGGYSRWSDGSVFGGVYYFGDPLLTGAALVLHPLSGGQISTLRFVAPVAGSYTFAGSFANADAATTDVYIARNNSSILFSGYVDPSLNFASFLTLSSGEYIDFMVGAGGNGYAFDSVQLVLNQPPAVVPEPATVALVATGLLCIFAARRRRRV